jgi:hypothetical protein
VTAFAGRRVRLVTVAAGVAGARGPVYYYAPGPAYPPGYCDYDYRDWLDYCFARYRSFDPRNGTYLSYDGRRHYCRSQKRQCPAHGPGINPLASQSSR